MNIQYILPSSLSHGYATPINIEVKQEAIAPHPIFNCPYCNLTYRNKKDLKEHKEKEHPQIKVEHHKIRKPKVESHLSLIGNSYVPQQPKFTCEYCYKGFDQSHRLKQHQISHREPVFNCDQVRDSFNLT
jgi:uncharacterized C2H2 Zn-finger protein